MATTGRPTDAAQDIDEVATLIRDADFVQLVGRSDGDALAAIGILGATLDTLETPSQVSLVTSSAAAGERLLDGGPTVGLGLDVGAGTVRGDSVALQAFEIATTLQSDPDPILAIAGAVAGGSVPSGPAFDAASDRGVERGPGLGLPTADVATGLAYSGRIHGRFSGDEQSAGAFLAELDLPAELDDDAHTRLASAVALDVTSEGSFPQAVAALDGILAPLWAPGPFETIEGYADVLDTLAMEDPGVGLGFVLGHDDRTDAVDAWRTTGGTLHETVDRLSLSRAGGVVAGSVEAADPRRVARLVRDFRVEESVVVIAGSRSVALATVDMDARETLASVFAENRVTGTSTLALGDEAATADVVVEQVTEAR